jgi:hypothetical protein
MGKFIIPQKSGSIIAQYENNVLSVTGKIDLPYSSKSVFLQNGLFVSICLGKKQKHRRLKIFDEHGTQLYKDTAYKFQCVNRKGNTVYLGGQYQKGETELFSYMDASAVDFTVNGLELPVKSTKGKSIDDILIRGNTLFLVDNIIFPKYIFTYDISDSNSPRRAGTEELPNNGTYEHIVKGDINDNWTALFSSSVGMNGAYQHITLTAAGQPWDNHQVLTFCVEDSFKRRNAGESGAAEPRHFIHDICLLRNRLLILEKSTLCALDLTKEITLENIVPVESNEAGYHKLLKINDERCLLVSEERYKVAGL